MDPASASSVAARARTENFPVASLLFPRALRPHLRSVYGFARLVDMIGDELEAEVAACYEGEPAWQVMRALQPTIRACDLPREPFLRLIEANRIDQRVSEYETWDELRGYCVHSADPVGRLVLGVVGRTEPELVALSDDVCTGLQLVNFLQDVPRDLELGRVYLPADDVRRFGGPALDRPSAVESMNFTSVRSTTSRSGASPQHSSSASRSACALYRSSSPARLTTTELPFRSMPVTGSSRMPAVSS